MDKQTAFTLLSQCALVNDVEMLDDQVTFHVIVNDPSDEDECFDKGEIVTELLTQFGVDRDKIMFNDCEDYLNEGTIFCS